MAHVDEMLLRFVVETPGEMQQETSTEKFKVHLSILDKKKKSKFVHFELSDIPKFTFAEELKEYLLQKYPNFF